MTFRLPTVVTDLTHSVALFGNTVTGRIGDTRFFQSSKRGEIEKLKKDLHSTSKEKKKETIKRIIAAMTIGKDVSSLFPDVVNCMQTTNIELKKLVYLYVINYAKVQPELAVLAINTFRKDSMNSSPLIRALAVRTMGCIKLPQVVEYLLEPLRRACKDSDPYVRKTAAICICKLNDTSMDVVKEQGFITILQEMLMDPNSTVVTNALAALSEISQLANQPYIKFTQNILNRLFGALQECSEWGQIFILDALATYVPADSFAALKVLENVTSRLNHANPAVVLSTIRVIFIMLNYISNEETINSAIQKLRPPLVTLLASDYEIQYVALRNISLIVQKFPNVLENEHKMFFCKYNDPHYVKVEKLEILIRLTTSRNFEEILQELTEYACEVDVEFVRHTIRAIGQCAIKVPEATENCLASLFNLTETQISYIVQEVVVVMKNIFRKYPNSYETLVNTLTDNVSLIHEPEAKQSLIWIIGEYAKRIPNAKNLLEEFVENFTDEPIVVRQQILVTAVKYFLKCPQKGQEIVTRVLKLCTETCDDPDLRDRGFIYWRLLSVDPEATKKILFSSKPLTYHNAFQFDSSELDILIQNISTLASVFHKAPNTFTRNIIQKSEPENLWSTCSENGKKNINFYQTDEKIHDKSYNLLDFVDSENSITSEHSASSTFEDKLKTLLEPSALGANGKKGLSVSGFIYKEKSGSNVLVLKLGNKSDQTLAGTAWAIQINKNSFGFAPKTTILSQVGDLAPDDEIVVKTPLVLNVNLSQNPPVLPLVLHVALRTSLDVFYLEPVSYTLSSVLDTSKSISKAVYHNHWQRMGQEKEHNFSAIVPQNYDSSLKILETEGLYIIDHYDENLLDVSYIVAVTTNKLLLLMEFIINKNANNKTVNISIRADAIQLIPLVKKYLVDLLQLTLIT